MKEKNAKWPLFIFNLNAVCYQSSTKKRSQVMHSKCFSIEILESPKMIKINFEKKGVGIFLAIRFEFEGDSGWSLLA